MEITVLLENSVDSDSLYLESEHGLSIHIQLENSAILFDVGRTDRYLNNAQKLGIYISEVDILCISHGHCDHGGGLESFLKVNSRAKIYMHSNAIGEFYSNPFNLPEPRSIGLDLDLINRYRDRVTLIDSTLTIADGIHIITNFSGEFSLPSSNNSLYTTNNSKLVSDPFNHEVELLIESKGKSTLFTGCSHSGVINMERTALEYLGIESLYAVVGGFHTHTPSTKERVSDQYLDELIGVMSKNRTLYFTGHCTGDESFKYIHKRLDNRVAKFATGGVINI